MIKHLRYFLSPLSLFICIISVLKGNYYPIAFIILFDIIIACGDLLFREDRDSFDNANPAFLNLSLYLNLPLLYILCSLVLFVMTDFNSQWYISLWNYFGVNVLESRANITFLDMCILFIYTTPLFIATMGTNVGHELTHRKKNKFDMFVGNWLLALSWDCTFAIEHVYGHHKNVGSKEDPATASRNENIYMFTLRSTFKAHKDAWKIEISRLKRRSELPFSFKNKMIKGYIRSLSVYVMSFYIGGLNGAAIFVAWSIIAKFYLEAINYIEHYGLVRVANQPVLPRHSWNSNHIMSSSLLYNLNRHSSHHEKANLKYWELKAYPNAPMLPYGYIQCLHMAFLTPFLYKNIMQSKLDEWDNNFASDDEKKILSTY